MRADMVTAAHDLRAAKAGTLTGQQIGLIYRAFAEEVSASG